MLSILKNIYPLKEEKKYIVYGDYAEEYQDISFRCDLKILGMYKAKDLNEAIKKIIEECSIKDIDKIENQEVTIVEINSGEERSICLDDVLYIQNLKDEEIELYIQKVTY